MRIGVVILVSLLAVTPAAGQADSSELERLESVRNAADGRQRADDWRFTKVYTRQAGLAGGVVSRV
ncbi:MAG: hypothetical protein JNL48_04295 [Acidobacteria bacterium]|nr:hypothetical protein [Acidobacteriota bacterium]